MGRTLWCLRALLACQHPADKKASSPHHRDKKAASKYFDFRNVEISYLPGREPGGVGEEGIYGSGGVGPSGARGVCACRPHHGRSNDMHQHMLSPEPPGT
jgi:hypothetical protein